jgi:hypothetical protein
MKDVFHHRDTEITEKKEDERVFPFSVISVSLWLIVEVVQ